MALASPIYVQPSGAGLPSDLLALQPSWDLSLQSAFASAKPQFEKVAKIVPVGASNKIILPFVDRTATMRLWEGERKYQIPQAYVIEATPEWYELTIQIDQAQYEDTGNVGNYWSGILTNVGNQIAMFPDSLIASSLQSGTSAETYDGQDFFSASHPVTPTDSASFGTQSNYLTGNPLTKANLALAIATLKNIKGADGQPFGSGSRGGLKLIVDPSNEDNAMSLVHSTMVGVAAPTSAGGTGIPSAWGAAPQNNPYLYGIAEVVVMPQLSNEPGVWYVLDNSLPAISSVFLAQREAFKVVPKISPTDNNVFDWHMFVFGVVGRMASQLGLYQCAVRSDPS